ncbi:MAG: hypothetical protein GX270_03400 [Clostridiaceae bacterium]|nr:hypothetical protein [Clostridiaceae bacterium]
MEDIEINKYVTTGRLYDFYSSMNDKEYIEIFRNKRKFNEVFQKFIGREYKFIDETGDHELICWLSGKKYLIAKPNYGVSGVGIEKIDISKWKNKADIVKYLRSKNLNLIEECVQQHESINQISSSSVNTIRIVTVQNQNQIDIISAVIRIGVNNHVDNFSAGGIAAPVDIETGIVFMPAVTKMGSNKYENHPITKTQIFGFNIPYWDEIVKMVTKAAWIVPQVRTVGWDIAVTQAGPLIIEGNDNWNKDAFQIPYDEGRQYVLEKYLSNKKREKIKHVG